MRVGSGTAFRNPITHVGGENMHGISSSSAALWCTSLLHLILPHRTSFLRIVLIRPIQLIIATLCVLVLAAAMTHSPGSDDEDNKSDQALITTPVHESHGSDMENELQSESGLTPHRAIPRKTLHAYLESMEPDQDQEKRLNHLNGLIERLPPGQTNSRINGKNALYIAIPLALDKAAPTPLEAGASISERHARDTPLHAVATIFAMVDLLLANGADVLATDRSGWAPLQNACLEGQAALAEHLLNKDRSNIDEGGWIFQQNSITSRRGRATHGHHRRST